MRKTREKKFFFILNQTLIYLNKRAWILFLKISFHREIVGKLKCKCWLVNQFVAFVVLGKFRVSKEALNMNLYANEYIKYCKESIWYSKRNSTWQYNISASTFITQYSMQQYQSAVCIIIAVPHFRYKVNISSCGSQNYF